MFARAEGFTMGVIFVEHPGTWPTAFEALIEAVNRQKVTAVALPSLFHFAAFGVPTDIRDSFERATGARVLVIRPVPWCAGDGCHLISRTRAAAFGRRALMHTSVVPV